MVRLTLIRAIPPPRAATRSSAFSLSNWTRTKTRKEEKKEEERLSSQQESTRSTRCRPIHRYVKLNKKKEEKDADKIGSALNKKSRSPVRDEGNCIALLKQSKNKGSQKVRGNDERAFWFNRNKHAFCDATGTFELKYKRGILNISICFKVLILPLPRRVLNVTIKTLRQA